MKTATRPTLADVIECARKAGETAMEYFRCSHEIGMHNKLNDSDIVTIADKQSETVIKSYIQTRYLTTPYFRKNQAKLTVLPAIAG